MSESLFSMTEEVKELYNMLTDDECDPEIVLDTLEGKFGEIEVKASAYTAVYNRLDMEMQRADEISKRYVSKNRSDPKPIYVKQVDGNLNSWVAYSDLKGV